MYIEKILIQNIKTYNKLEFKCNSQFNFIIGENNIGKTTIFDALLIWNMAYQALIKANGKEFYKKTSWNSMNITFGKLLIFRLVNASNIFNNTNASGFITLCINDGISTHNLEIEINIPDIKDSYIRFRNHHKLDDFQNFASYCSMNNIKLKDAVSMDITKPISTVLRDEPFLNKAQILKKSYTGRSIETLRNKILNTMEDKKFEYLETVLYNILDIEYKLIFKNSNRDDEENVRILIKENSKPAVDLYLVGSGILHILEIFASLNKKNLDSNKLNILLLDEPDSHIHGNIQVKVINELRKIDNSQIFIISHNDRFIMQAQNSELFYLNNTVKEQEVLEALNIENISNIQEELSGTLQQFSLIEEDKAIVILEGKTDKKIIETAWEKLYNSTLPFELIPSGFNPNEEARTGSAKTVKSTIEYISTIAKPEQKIIGLFDNDREGNSQFKGLNREIFEDYNSENFRKHKEKNIYGLRLPYPSFRSEFVSESSVTQRYFVIEHYFENDILEANNMKGENILTTNVFEIKGNKNNFSTNVTNFDANSFQHFEVLFSKIKELLEIT